MTAPPERVESLLVGVAQQGITEYETQCALEYLLSPAEVEALSVVDPKGRLDRVDLCRDGGPR